MLVGYYEKGKLRYAGKVGTGYTRAMLMELRERLGWIERAGCPFKGWFAMTLGSLGVVGPAEAKSVK